MFQNIGKKEVFLRINRAKKKEGRAKKGKRPRN